MKDKIKSFPLKQFRMPPKIPLVIPPRNGWQRHTHYIVDVSMNEWNPIHKRILYVGFLNGSNPLNGNYTGLLLAPGDDFVDMKDIHFIQAIRKIKNL